MTALALLAAAVFLAAMGWSARARRDPAVRSSRWTPPLYFVAAGLALAAAALRAWG